MSENPGPSKRSRKQVLVPRVETSSEYLRPPSPDQVAPVNQPSRQEVQAGERQISRYAAAVFRLIKLGMVDQRRALLTYNQTTHKMGNREKNHSAFINGEVEDLLKEVCDTSTGFQDVLPNLCRLTEIPKDSGSCLGDCFKLSNGKFAHDVTSDVAYMSLRKAVYGNYDTTPDFLWLNITGGRKPIIFPTKNVRFSKGTIYNLVGVVCGGPEQFVTVVTQGGRFWKNKQLMTSVDLIPFSLLYHKVHSGSRKVLTPPASISNIWLTQEDLTQINDVFDNRNGRRKTPGRTLLNPDADQPGEKLLKPQMAASAVLHDRHLPQKKSQFLLTNEDLNELILRLGVYPRMLLYSDIFGEDVEGRGGLRVLGRNVWTADNAFGSIRSIQPLCSRCLQYAVKKIYVDERTYCSAHFPDGSVDYLIYVATSETNDEDNYVDWNVSRKGERKIEVSERTYNADKKTVHICSSFEEASLKFHAMTIVLWLRNALSGFQIKCKSMWPTRQFDDFNTEKLIENIDLFERFEISVKGGPHAGSSASWDREKALRYGFLFGNSNVCLKNVYSLIYEKNESQNGVYIGKNSGIHTVASMRKRPEAGQLIDERCVALTPNSDMLNYLESIITLSAGVGSIFGIPMNGCAKNPVLKNYLMPVSSRVPADVKAEEYLAAIFLHLFNVDLRFELIRSNDGPREICEW